MNIGNTAMAYNNNLSQIVSFYSGRRAMSSVMEFDSVGLWRCLSYIVGLYVKALCYREMQCNL